MSAQLFCLIRSVGKKGRAYISHILNPFSKFRGTSLVPSTGLMKSQSLKNGRRGSDQQRDWPMAAGLPAEPAARKPTQSHPAQHLRT